MNDAITLITDEKEDLQTLISAAKCFESMKLFL